MNRKFILALGMTISIFALSACQNQAKTNETSMDAPSQEGSVSGSSEEIMVDPVSTPDALSDFHLTEDSISYEGDTLTITVDSNPTTGYDWNIQLKDRAVLDLVDSAYVQESFQGESAIKPSQEDSANSQDAQIVEEPLSGAGGYSVYTFKAHAGGHETITFTYTRSFDPQEDDPVNVLEVTVDENKNITSALITR